MLKKILAFSLAISMLLATACGNSNSSDDSQTESSSSEQAIDSSSVDSSSGTETMSSSKSTSDSESSVSERETITETKAADDSSASDTTSTKATADVTNTTNTTKITSSTTSKVTSQSTTKSTTKSTTTTTKTTTKQTTKATSSTSSPTTKPTGLTKLESAVWDISLDYSITYNNYRSNKNLAIIREELIKYGQEFCKQRNAPKYQVNSKMYPYYDKNGNPLYAPCDMKGNNIAVGSKVEFPYDEHEIPSSYSTAQERLSGVRAFIKAMQLYIERVICNSFRHGLENMQWNITYGYEYCGICWTVMTGFPDDWK